MRVIEGQGVPDQRKPPTPPDDDEADLWFLPGPLEDRAPTDPPWPMDRLVAGFDPADWLRAESRSGRALADAAAGIARLDERLRTAPGGYAERLALMEISDQLWAQGDWVAVEKLALYRQLRLSTVESARALSEADWAMRRILAGKRAIQGLDGGLAEFLGRREREQDDQLDFGQRPVGAAFERLAADWLSCQKSVLDAHPLTQAAVGFFSWRALGLSEPGAVLEPMAAATAYATAGLSGSRLLPVALGDKYVFAKSGPAKALLTDWYKAVENGCLRGLLALEQLEHWRQRATDETSDLSGKTPPLLIQSLLESPLVSAEMVAGRSGVSNVSALRNLSLFRARGLVREVTGQARYRFWAATV